MYQPRRFFVLWLVLLLLLPAQSFAALDQNSKLDQLFMWKMSEELSLSVKQEQQLTEIVKDLNQRRKDLNSQTQSMIAKNAKLTDTKELNSGLKSYQALLKKQLDLNLEEIERVKTALGPEKLAQYLQVKSDLSVKVKSLLLKSPSEEPSSSDDK